MPYLLKKVGSIPHVEYLTPGYDDILIISPEEAYKDSNDHRPRSFQTDQRYLRASGRRLDAESIERTA